MKLECIDIKHDKFLFENYFKSTSELLNKDNKVKYAQYYTGKDIAIYMANMFKKLNKKVVRILDPGCGMGMLTAAFLDRLIKINNRKIEKVIITMYEIDRHVIEVLQTNMNKISEECQNNGLEIEYSIVNQNYIQSFSNKDELKFKEKFDYVIMNPPYMKIIDN